MSELGAFGQLSGLFYLNIPKCVKHKEDHPIPIRRPGGFADCGCRTGRQSTAGGSPSEERV